MRSFGFHPARKTVPNACSDLNQAGSYPTLDAMKVERRGTGGWDEVLEHEAYLVAPGAEWRSELYRVAMTQFTQAADLLQLEPECARACSSRAARSS